MSKIIKSTQAHPASIGEFAFKPISGVLPPQGGGNTPAGGFVPMGLVGAQETGGRSVSQPEEPPAEPSGITLSENELNLQLQAAFDKGLVEGKNLAERGLLNVFKSLRTATEGIRSLREKVLRESEEELLKLILMVSRKVIQKEVAQDRRIVAGVVEAGIAAISERDELTIRLNPDDYILVTRDHEEYFRQELITNRMNLKSDPTVQMGFCQIDSEMGTLDAGIDAQLEEIYRRLLEERSAAQDEEV